jgi:hypothetical protein
MPRTWFNVYHRLKINIFGRVFGIRNDAFGVTLNAKDMADKILITDLKLTYLAVSMAFEVAPSASLRMPKTW